ncbi:MAG: Uncharacterized protein FD153_1643 [Rhodospirillaceae bacterium]|nr:MAG: Uncharacterized protein FD153_1643 [Rhodospirillaceae bacterium]
MPDFDAEKLLQDMDPVFRSEEEKQFAVLQQEADAFFTTQVARYNKAIRLLAAALYAIARNLEMQPHDMGVIATYTIGLFAGASCQDSPETLHQMQRMFTVSLKDANADKNKAAMFMAQIVTEGIDMIHKTNERHS